MLVAYLFVGLLAGVVSGAFGLGGGTIIIPVFVYLFGLTQHQAQGTALAIMVPPIGLLAALRYYYSGNVKVDMAVLVAIGFLLGAYWGAHFIQNIPAAGLKRAFGIYLIIIGIKMALLK